jgi:hypothetical protein
MTAALALRPFENIGSEPVPRPAPRIVPHSDVSSPRPELNPRRGAASVSKNNRVPVSFDNKSAAEFVADIIEVEFGQHRSKAKAVAAHTAGTATPRTVETWARKVSAPSLAAFLNMCVGPKPIPSLRAEMRRLLTDVADGEIDDSRAIHEMHRILRMMEGRS